MRPSDDIENMFTQTPVETNTEVDKVVLDDAVRAMSRSRRKMPVFNRPDVWRILMKSKITKLAIVTAITLIVGLSVTFLDQSMPSAYALEQTMEAYENLRFVHIKDFREGESEPQELWVELDEQEQVKRFRASLPPWAEREGPMIAVWSKGKLRIWRKKDNVLATKHTDSLGLEMLKLVKGFDPRTVVKELHQLEAEGKAEIEIYKPESESDPIVITAKNLSPSRDVGNQLVLTIERDTKLVTRIAFNKLKDSDGHKHSWEFSDYNIEVDESIFTLDEVPANATRLHAARYNPDPDTAATFMKNINTILATLDINKSTADDVIAVLGEPRAYRFEGEVLEKDNLPEVYAMDYPGSFMVSIYYKQVMLWGAQQIPGQDIQGYVFSDAIQIGSTLDEVFKELGSPVKVVDGFGTEDNDVLYEDNTGYVGMDIDERKGFCFHRYDGNGKEIKLYYDDNVLYKGTGKMEGICFYGTVSDGRRIRILSSDNKVVAIYEYRTEPIK